MSDDTIYTDASAFNAALTDLANRIDGEVELIIKKVCIDLFSRIVQRTPVDTGRAKANWNIDIVDNDSRQEETSTDNSLSKAETFLRQNFSEYIVIYNNVEYISILEEGSSQQAPSGMVAVSLSDFTRHLEEALRSMNL